MFKQTLETRMVAASAHSSGFDYLRLLLAVGVLCWHSVITSSGDNRWLWSGPFRPAGAALMPMFFALSGFLVAASLERTRTLRRFFLYRGLRIIPALAVEVALSALLLGPLLTTEPLTTYFSAGDFYRYFLNILGEIHYTLPGIFADNPYPGIVNVSLWTIPYELACYATLAMLAICGLTQAASRPLLALLVMFALICAGTSPDAFPDLTQERTVPGMALPLAFLLGMLAQFYRHKIPHNLPLFLLALAASLLLLANARHIFWALIPLTYCTVWLGLLNPPRARVLLNGDYSYGLYLFAFPIQQAYAHLAPQPVWWQNVLICLPLGLCYAAFSWHLIENPVLARKSKVADRLGV